MREEREVGVVAVFRGERGMKRLRSSWIKLEDLVVARRKSKESNLNAETKVIAI